MTQSTAAAAPEPVGALAPLERQEWMRVHAQAVGELRAAQDIITRHHISAPDVLALTGGTMPAAHPAPAVAAIVRQLTESEVTELLSRRDWRDENLRELIAETAQVCATAWGVKLAATEEQQ